MNELMIVCGFFAFTAAWGFAVARLVRYRNAENQVMRNSILRKKVN
jgi:hypothetical protein